MGLVLIMDIRRPLTDLDIQMLDWFLPTGKPVHILLTKSDKLNRQQASLALRQVKQALGERYPGASAQLFSSPKHQGIEEAEQIINEWFTRSQEEKAPD